jgi:hypothetical protein
MIGESNGVVAGGGVPPVEVLGRPVGDEIELCSGLLGDSLGAVIEAIVRIDGVAAGLGRCRRSSNRLRA